MTLSDKLMSQVVIKFDHWPHPSLFPNKAGNTMHWGQRSALRKSAKEEAYFLTTVSLNNYRLKSEDWLDHLYCKATILILVTAKDKRKRDLDGFLTACKPWLDGIVDAGILEDDNYFVVPEITIRFEGVSTESVSIVIEELLQ